jgi:hypothetical protein
MVPSSLTSYISLMRCVSYAVSPTNTITPITDIAQSSPVECRKMLTTLAQTHEHERTYAGQITLRRIAIKAVAPNVAAEMKNTRVIEAWV